MKRTKTRQANLESRMLEDRAGEKAAKERRGIACPWCKAVGKSQVRKTYDSKEHGVRRRNRFCTACNRSFVTDEIVRPT